MKSRFIVLFILILLTLTQLTALDYPGSAVGDDFLSIRVNPAAMAFGNASGIAFLQPYLLEDEPEEEPELLTDFSLQAAGSNIGYFFDKQSDQYSHNLLFAGEFFPNIYLGFNAKWENDAFGGTESTLGVLARPSDYLSLGLVGERVFTGDQRGRLGFGFRPFAFHPFNTSDRSHEILTLGADLPWDDGLKQPVLHAMSEPLPGFAFSLAYDLEANLFTAGISYSLGVGRVGTLIDGDTRGAAFVHLGTRAYTTPRVPLTDPYIRLQPGPRIVEETPPGFAFFAPRDRSLLEVTDEIERLRKDPAVRGIVIENENFVTSRAGYLELIDSLTSFRREGKKVVYYYENISLWNYLLAAATGDAIYLHRMGSLDLRGIGARSVYFGGLLEKYGVRVHNIRSHPYKSGMNTVSESGMTPEEREMLDYLYRGIYTEFIRLINEGRGERLKGDLETLIAEGPYLISNEALAAGLVDGIIFADELSEKLISFDDHPVITDGYFIEPFRRDWSDPYNKQIALIYAVGTIIPGRGVPGSSIGAETLCASIREARENPNVKALLLRIDSGGGSSLASDVIAREIKLTVEAGKPVVASLAGTAASGGYYIAAYADKIVVSPVSVTGSIGVYAAFPEFAALLEEYEVGSAEAGTHENADFLNPLRQLERAEKEKIEAVVERIYQLFVEVVAEGRGMEHDAVDAAARGRVWSGSQAVDRGLADQLGGLQDALTVAVEEAGIRGEYMLVDYSNRDLPLSLRMARTFGASVKESLPPVFVRAMDQAAIISLMEKERYLYLAPYAPFDNQ